MKYEIGSYYEQFDYPHGRTKTGRETVYHVAFLCQFTKAGPSEDVVTPCWSGLTIIGRIQKQLSWIRIFRWDNTFIITIIYKTRMI